MDEYIEDLEDVEDMADAEFDNMDTSKAEETLEDNDGRAARTVPYHQS